MNEKQMEIVNQYDVDVKDSYRSRGCLHINTEQGLFMVIPYGESPLRLAYELELQKRLTEEGFDRVDLILENRENGLISYDKYKNPFILKRAFKGRECSLKEEKEVEAAAYHLGRLHKILRNLPEEMAKKRKSPAIPELLYLRNREMRRIRKFIGKSGRRTEFELTFTSCYDAFAKEAAKALALAAEQRAEIWERGSSICHGAYHQHNILLLEESDDPKQVSATEEAGQRNRQSGREEEAAVLNFGHYHGNQQILDLYHFMRKALEKNGYRKRIFEAAVRGYEREIPLEEEDYLLLKILFTFPEKFWKISNQYFNSKKCFLPPKNLEKLKKTIDRAESREAFARQL